MYSPAGRSGCPVPCRSAVAGPPQMSPNVRRQFPFLLPTACDFLKTRQSSQVHEQTPVPTLSQAEGTLSSSGKGRGSDRDPEQQLATQPQCGKPAPACWRLIGFLICFDNSDSTPRARTRARSVIGLQSITLQQH